MGTDLAGLSSGFGAVAARTNVASLPGARLSGPHLSGSRTLATQKDFASILGIENRGKHARLGTPEEKARRVAQEFVATAFIEPMLAEVREANKTPPPFGPGKGEQQFGAMIDAQRAIEMVRSSSWPIVDRLTADLTKAEINRAGRLDAAKTPSNTRLKRPTDGPSLMPLREEPERPANITLKREPSNPFRALRR